MVTSTQAGEVEVGEVGEAANSGPHMDKETAGEKSEREFLQNET